MKAKNQQQTHYHRSKESTNHSQTKLMGGQRSPYQLSQLSLLYYYKEACETSCNIKMLEIINLYLFIFFFWYSSSSIFIIIINLYLSTVNHQLSLKKVLKKCLNTVLHDCREGIRYVRDSI